MTFLRPLLPLSIAAFGILTSAAAALSLKKDSRIVLLGNGLGSRMMQFGSFETSLHLQHPKKNLFIRNMCDEGNTPGFRPHSARATPWAFPGAEKFHPPLSKTKDRWGSTQTGSGSMPTPDEWLTQLKPDILIAFFGFNESFNGPAGLENFRGELHAFIAHTRSQKYNGTSAPQLALVSPTAFEDPSNDYERNIHSNLGLYTAAMEEIARTEKVTFVNCFVLSKSTFSPGKIPLTRDGILLNKDGYSYLQQHLIRCLFGIAPWNAPHDAVQAAVREKNWMWEKYYKIPNGVHVYGRRHRPFGPVNYPPELKKLEQLTANRDHAIWAALAEKTFDLAAADAKTEPLPEVKTNYRPSKKNGTTEYLYNDKALASFTTAPGYKIDLFASEKEFPHLANPIQLAFDNQGRLWVATMPTYPHYKPGDAKPNDKLLILEDTNNDGKADKETIFANNLHLPTGFEISHNGVYVAQGNHLILLKDTDGDDKADVREVVLSGFDDHDTHHVISAFCADPSGAIYMGEGTFLHSNIETAYGPIRSSNGGFFRYSPQRNHLERTARLSIPNPWGTAFDDFGQPFFLETSDPDLHWMTPGSVNVDYGQFTPKPPSILEKSQRVRPTSGLEFVSSRHFPDDVQGDVLLNNTIGFLGTKQHHLSDSEAGFTSKHRHDLLKSSDGNFRPVDLEFAPDGSLYLVDWHNVLVGHMQHSARDPLRDHLHGRIYRITYPERPLVKPAQIHNAPIATLFENLTLPEYRTRYRTRRELRARNATEVLPALQKWTASLKPNSPRYEHIILEALWVTWGFNQVSEGLLKKLLSAKDHRVRAAAVDVLRYSGHQIPNQSQLLQKSAFDTSARVRLQAAVAASWLTPEKGLAVLAKVSKHATDNWIKPVLTTAEAHLKGQELATETDEKHGKPTSPLKGANLISFNKGAEVYSREGHCITCHQSDGEGLPAAMFPPLAGTKWVQGSEDRLIKLTLNGLLGPIEIKGKIYPGQVPMTAFKQLSDEELAAVLTYVRNTFGNKASIISPAKVKQVREATKNQNGFYAPADIEND
ncbi:MAG: c-type cytochrome [Akkermansiaceae bacterium]|nr:c-type cytochrome [Akkermansiaceae bacterium]